MRHDSRRIPLYHKYIDYVSWTEGENKEKYVVKHIKKIAESQSLSQLDQQPVARKKKEFCTAFGTLFVIKFQDKVTL